MPAPLVASGGHDAGDSRHNKRTPIYQHWALENPDRADNLSVLPHENAPITVPSELKWRHARRSAPVDAALDLSQATSITLVHINPGAQFNRRFGHSGRL